MENFVFMLWMLLFPICVSISEYIDTLKNKASNKNKKYSESTDSYSALFLFFIWIYVGACLYK